MSLNDFLRPWKVIPPGTDECPMGSEIEITGVEGKSIVVQCVNNGQTKTYVGDYIEGNNSIDLGDYEIRLHIIYAPKNLGRRGGSWTAVDHPPGADE